MALILKGEAGKALDATERSCALLKIRDMELRKESMADDSLTWTARTADIAGYMTIVPDAEQAISLYRDGVRIFHGHASEPRDVLRGARVTVLGPWWWLRREQLTQSTGGSDQPTMQFPEQSVKASIVQLLTRAIAKGVPMRIGAIAGMPTFPKQSYSEATYADILAELLKLVPDAVGWWDYSGTGLPSFNVTRVAGATSVSYGLNEVVEPFEVTPVVELVASRVELTYYTRDATGLPVLQVQAAGIAAPGKTQVIAISGPERDTFVPKDDLENFTVQTTNANVTMNTLRPFILNLLPEVVASRAAYAGKPAAGDVTLANGEVLESESNMNPSDTGITVFHAQPALVFTDKTTGAVVSRVGKHLVLTPDVPEWLNLPGMQRVKITGRIYVLVAQGSSKSPYGVGDNITSTPPPAWAPVFPWTLKQSMSPHGDPPPFWMDVTSFAQPAFYIRHQNQIWALDFEIEAAVTTTPYLAATVFYKPPEFEYLTPPAGMAEALLAMQTRMPYRGTLTRKGVALCNGAQMLNCKFNVTGGRPPLATMQALPKAVSYDFRSKIVSIELGPPARFDTRSLANRFRQPAQTNITYTT